MDRQLGARICRNPIVTVRGSTWPGQAPLDDRILPMSEHLAVALACCTGCGCIMAPWPVLLPKELLMITDPTMVRIGEGVQLHHGRGQREAARHVFTEVWEEIGGEQGDPLHVSVLAHSMADVQDDVHQELLWDQRALAAADLLTDDRLAQAGVTLLSVAGLYPSLHLNLADCYRRLGDPGRAREHLQQAQAGIGALDDDEYGQLIKGGLERLTQQLTPE